LPPPVLKIISGVFSSVIVHHVDIDFGVRVSVLRLKENGPNGPFSLTTEAEPVLPCSKQCASKKKYLHGGFIVQLYCITDILCCTCNCWAFQHLWLHYVIENFIRIWTSVLLTMSCEVKFADGRCKIIVPVLLWSSACFANWRSILKKVDGAKFWKCSSNNGTVMASGLKQKLIEHL
jgi:hypothetical protein